MDSLPSAWRTPGHPELSFLLVHKQGVWNKHITPGKGRLWGLASLLCSTVHSCWSRWGSISRPRALLCSRPSHHCPLVTPSPHTT